MVLRILLFGCMESRTLPLRRRRLAQFPGLQPFLCVCVTYYGFVFYFCCSSHGCDFDGFVVVHSDIRLLLLRWHASARFLYCTCLSDPGSRGAPDKLPPAPVNIVPAVTKFLKDGQDPMVKAIRMNP